MSRPRKNKLTDNSSDAKYFILTPRLIWALARDAYDVSLWNTIKDIAGEHGECYLSTPDLATLAMMSVGKVQDSRAYWIEVKMLGGQIVRDEGYPQPVWHLTIPDIWKRNIEWAEQHKELKERITYKREQTSVFKAKRKSVHQANAQRRSPGEKGGTPHEKGGLPGERKNNQKNNQKEKPENGANAPTPEEIEHYKSLKAKRLEGVASANAAFEENHGSQSGIADPTQEDADFQIAARWYRLRIGGELPRSKKNSAYKTEMKAVRDLMQHSLDTTPQEWIVILKNIYADPKEQWVQKCKSPFQVIENIVAYLNKENGNGQSTDYQPNTYTPEEWASFTPYSADELRELRELAESAGA